MYRITFLSVLQEFILKVFQSQKKLGKNNVSYYLNTFLVKFLLYSILIPKESQKNTQTLKQKIKMLNVCKNSSEVKKREIPKCKII